MTQLMTLMSTNKGYQQATLGIISELEKHFMKHGGEILPTCQFDTSAFNTIAEFTSKAPTIIVTSSLEHIKEIEKIGLSNRESGSDVRLVWQSHQLPDIDSDEMRILKDHVHDIVIPRHEEVYAIKAGLSERTIFTTGVPHMLTCNIIKEAAANYDNLKYQTVVENIKSGQISGIDVAIMGGDYQTRGGENISYDWGCASQEGSTVAHHYDSELDTAHDAIPRFLIATNGPRTGKILSANGRAHVGDYSIDDVSEAYVGGLTRSGLHAHAEEPVDLGDFEFFDFRFKNEGGVDSVYHPALALLDDQSTIYCEGMSVTMAYEILAVKPKDARLVLVDLGTSMLESHYSHMSYMNKMGWADILHSNGALTPANKIVKNIESPAMEAAKFIYSRAAYSIKIFGIPALKISR